MKFLGFLEKVTDEKYKIGMIHNMPFDQIHGLRKTQEELETEGILVENIPPEQIQDNTVSTLYYNPLTKQAWYEYNKVIPIEIPSVKTPDKLE
jgi:hypothetical protein